MSPYKPPERNFDGVQFAELRQQIDGKYNAIHDELSRCYYEGLPFRDYGILDKETFDKLHGLIFMKLHVEFDQENEKRAVPYPKEKYDLITNDEGQVKSKTESNNQKIAELNAEGIDI